MFNMYLPKSVIFQMSKGILISVICINNYNYSLIAN